MHKYWNSFEIEFLKNNYKYGAIFCAEKLKRPRRTIKNLVDEWLNLLN